MTIPVLLEHILSCHCIGPSNRKFNSLIVIMFFGLSKNYKLVCIYVSRHRIIIHTLSTFNYIILGRIIPLNTSCGSRTQPLFLLPQVSCHCKTIPFFFFFSVLCQSLECYYSGYFNFTKMCKVRLLHDALKAFLIIRSTHISIAYIKDVIYTGSMWIYTVMSFFNNDKNSELS